MVSAEQAREVLEHAELRRAVVDEHGSLVSIDTHVHRPDQAPELIDDPARRVSHEQEPDQTEPAPETAVDPDDQAWVHDQLDTHGATTADAAEDAVGGVVADVIATPDTEELAGDVDAERDLDVLVAELTSDLETALTAMLTEHALVGVTPVRQQGMTIEADSPFHRRPGPADPPDNGGPGGSPRGGPPPPDPTPPERDLPDSGPADPPPPEPPSDADRLAHAARLDREDYDPRIPEPRYEREPKLTPGPRPRPLTWTSSWSPTALRRALSKVLTTPVDLKPLDSTAYALPPRLARFVKYRDITCTFPGCIRLARDCENDHIVPFPLGPTTALNITNGCTHHHQAKHHYFTIERLPGGTIRWHTPMGRHYDRTPRNLLRGW